MHPGGGPSAHQEEDDVVVKVLTWDLGKTGSFHGSAADFVTFGKSISLCHHSPSIKQGKQSYFSAFSVVSVENVSFLRDGVLLAI